MRRGQPIGAATGQHHRIYLVHQVGRVQQVGLTCAGCRATDINATDRTIGRQHHGGSGKALLKIANLDARHVSDGIVLAWLQGLPNRLGRLNRRLRAGHLA